MRHAILIIVCPIADPRPQRWDCEFPLSGVDQPLHSQPDPTPWLRWGQAEVRVDRAYVPLAVSELHALIAALVVLLQDQKPKSGVAVADVRGMRNERTVFFDQMHVLIPNYSFPIVWTSKGAIPSS